MEELPSDSIFPSMNLSPIRHPSKTSTTPQTASPSSAASSVPSMMMEECISQRVDGSDSDGEGSISLDELISGSKRDLLRVTLDPTRQQTDQSSTACIGSLNSSRETMDTSAAIAISPQDLAQPVLKAQQKEARKTQAHKQKEATAPNLQDYIKKTKSKAAITSFDDSNATLNGGGLTTMKRSKSQESLPRMEEESVDGLKFARRRSSSFSATSPLEQANDKLFEVISRMRLEEDDDTAIDHGKTLEKLKKYSDSIEDGSNDEDSYMHRARGRHFSRQYSVRDTRSKRDKEIRTRRSIRREQSAHQLKKADDFLQATDANSLKDVVDSWKNERNHQKPGRLHRHLSSTSQRFNKYESHKRDKNKRRSTRKLSQVIASKEPSLLEEGHETVSRGNETSETSLISDYSGTNGSGTIGSRGAVEEAANQLSSDLDTSPIKNPNESAEKEQRSTTNSVSREASETSMLSDTSDMIVSPYQCGLREDLNVHHSSDPYLSPIKNKRYERRDEQRLPAGEAALSHSDHEDSSCHDGSSNIVQFDAGQDDHISHVHLDLASGHLVRIECEDGPLMEGLICGMPESVDEGTEENGGSQHENGGSRDSTVEGEARVPCVNASAHSTSRQQMLWKGPSKFFRRQKAQRTDKPEINHSSEPMQFDEFGRLL